MRKKSAKEVTSRMSRTTRSRACLDSAACTAVSQIGSGSCSFWARASEQCSYSYRTTIGVFMRFLFLLSLTAVLTLAAADSPEILHARQELERVRQQAADGLLPKAQIIEAEQAVDDA